MKSGVCPKCGSGDILKIPGHKEHYGSGGKIRGVLTVFSGILLTRFICAKCGFSEEWLEKTEEIWPD